ncbi:HEAT repeat domain-containing protein [Micromonospora chaiyaphumensis]|uniref:HEAT repeat-containing protein n=1 Tax=Micromonospora chaiyaphumensis TaxID=307119 RepID=A0A1C4XNK0_9ACTN|nr:HEAT repeat domain-containing protein [Micromonospora chaiyaphumensis]SCF09993.1 hypothetical protein GA0070214_106205 [Micromonospora chaiyaphumensis]
MPDVVETLLRLARSDDYSERAHAGAELSLFAGSETVDQALVELLLDDDNTSVVQGTAEALLKRGDSAALRPFAAAWHLVESQVDNTHLTEIADYLYGAISYGLWIDSTDPRRTGLRRVLATLLDDQDQTVRKGADGLLGQLGSTS